jgi:hypothetical protein
MSAQHCRICGEAIRLRGRAWIHAESSGSGAGTPGGHRAEALSDDLAAVAEMARIIRRHIHDAARGDPHRR